MYKNYLFDLYFTFPEIYIIKLLKYLSLGKELMIQK